MRQLFFIRDESSKPDPAKPFLLILRRRNFSGFSAACSSGMRERGVRTSQEAAGFMAAGLSPAASICSSR